MTVNNVKEIEDLIKIVSKLPGLGPKSAKRIVLILININANTNHSSVSRRGRKMSANAWCIFDSTNVGFLTRFA